MSRDNERFISTESKSEKQEHLHNPSEYMGKLSLRYFGPVVWETMLPEKYKDIDNLGKFQDDIKGWIPDCKCRLCKTYVASVGFIEISK